MSARMLLHLLQCTVPPPWTHVRLSGEGWKLMEADDDGIRRDQHVDLSTEIRELGDALVSSHGECWLTVRLNPGRVSIDVYGSSNPFIFLDLIEEAKHLDKLFNDIMLRGHL